MAKTIASEARIVAPKSGENREKVICYTLFALFSARAAFCQAVFRRQTQATDFTQLRHPDLGCR
jgi:hypothetical protein